jgi:hypothetical protein
MSESENKINLNKQKQKYRHLPDDDIHGDCSRTVIACLLGIPRDLVPDPNNNKNWTSREFFKNEDNFLAKNGYVRQWFRYSGEISLEHVLESTGYTSGSKSFALIGTSKNGTNHAVVARSFDIEWDPSLDDTGIVGPASDGYWYTYILWGTTDSFAEHVKNTYIFHLKVDENNAVTWLRDLGY